MLKKRTTHTSRLSYALFLLLILAISLCSVRVPFLVSAQETRARQVNPDAQTLRDARARKISRTVYLSDLEPVVAGSSAPAYERDRTSGSRTIPRGQAIVLNGTAYQKGLGVTSPSELRYPLGGLFTTFRADAGLVDATGWKGTVVFQVFADGQKVFDSGVITGASPTRAVEINVTGKYELKLVVTDAGDGSAFDVAAWANARLEGDEERLRQNAAPAHRHRGQVNDDPNHAVYDAILAAQAKKYPAFVRPTDLMRAEAPEDLIRLGQWSAVKTWPFVFASAASLPDGRILAWGGNNPTSFNGGTTTYGAIWNPTTDQITSANHNDHSMFCGIPTMLEDGRVFVNGGDGTRERVSVFDFRTNVWSRLENMNRGRWYPGSVALPTGQVFTALGEPGDIYPEIWTPGQGWSLLTGANLQAPILNFTGYQKNWLPYLHLAPNGLIFHTGPTQQMNWMNFTGNGSVSDAGLDNTWYPKYSGTVMYDEGRLLATGGQINGDNQAATNQAMVINLNGTTPTRTLTNPMGNARKFHNAIVLPTGEVMVVGGNTSGIEFSDQGTVLTPEIWNPDTQTWRVVADMSVPRNYHSVALLMPDGRVWSGGGGLCACAADHPDHQVYTPGYLYAADGRLATRPTITTAPTLTTAGRTISVAASTGVTKFSLIKMSGLTHNLNSDLRYLRVPFTSDGTGQYQLSLHNNVNVLTPGYWMLFALNSAGVPSAAKVIQVVSNTGPSVTNPGAQTSFVGDAVSLQISANDPTNDPLTFSATGLPAGLRINNSTGRISGTATTAGTYRVTVSVSDGGLTSNTSFDWFVTPRGTIRYVRLEALSEVNGNPWTSAAEINLLDTNGNAISRAGWTVTTDSEETQGENGRAINAIDGNSTTIWHTQWQAASPAHPHQITFDLKANYTIGGFRYLPRQDAVLNGTIADYRLYVSADGVNWGTFVAQGRLAADNTEKTVTVRANQNPSLSLLPNRTNSVGEVINLTITASDPDGDALTYSATGLPGGLSLNSTTGVISGTLNTIATYNTTITVSDGRGGTASRNFTWTVTPPALTINPMTSSPKPVNTAINYTATVSNAVNPRFKWLFGDGTAETAYSTSPGISHAFTQPGIYVVKVTATDDRGVEKSTTFTQAIHLPTTANRPAVSMNIAVESRATGNARLWVVNQDNDTVSVFDAVTNAKAAEIAVGKAPRSVAVAPNGRLWVTNKGAATISVIDPATLTVVQTITLPYGSQPFGVAFSPAGGSAWVTLEAAGRLCRLDASTGAINANINVGQNVRHLSISADGSIVYVSRFITPAVPGEGTAAPQVASGGGEVLAVNTGTLSIANTIRLRHSDKFDSENAGRGIPNYLGPAVISPDGRTAWTPSKQDNILRGALRDGNNLTFETTVRSITSNINLTTATEDYAARIDHNNGGIASTGLFDRTGNYLFVALEGSREIAVIDAYGKRELARLDVGRAPQGLALSADGLRLFVSNFMDRTVSVLDVSSIINAGASTATTVATLNSVATEKLTAQVLRGKQFFYDAKDTRLARDAYISCASCHNDGGQDGRVWDLTGFGEGLRNTINLQGRGGLAHGFLHWSANFDEVQDFEAQIRNLAGGSGLMTDAQFNTGTRNQPLGDRKTGVSADLDALAAYLTSLNTFANSPNRSNGALTADAVAGRDLFRTANCAQCHSGSAFTEAASGTLRNIGTIKPSSGKRLNATLTGIDTPTLRDVWATAPYLHDGSALTLEDAVRAHSGLSLTSADITRLVAYLQQIGNEETTAPTNTPVGTGLLAEYYDNLNFTGAKVTRTDATVNFDWGTGSPISGIAADTFSVRWRGQVKAKASETHTFFTTSDDGVRLWVNGRLLINNWTDHAPTENSATITLQAGQMYSIVMDYYETGGGAVARLSWSSPSQAKQIIPQDCLYPATASTQTSTNLALGRAAVQSSNYNATGTANKAVDGNTNGSFNSGSVTHTGYNTNAWWQIDLGVTRTIETIQLYNRTDCCGARLSNFYVFVSNSNLTGRSLSNILADSAVSRWQVTGAASSMLTIPATARGRYVRVQLAGTNYLSLAEVQVLGR